MRSCGLSCVKTLLFVFNFVFWLSGVALIAGGGYALSKVKDYEVLVGDKIIINLPIVAIVAGSIIFLVSFFGCCGASKESKCMLQTFIALLVVILILELAVGIGAAVYKKDIGKEFKKTMQGAISTAITDRNSTEAKAWDIMQEELQCCGVDSRSDWGTVIPNSCKTYSTGCYDKLKDLVSDQATLLIGIGFGVIVIKLAGIIFASCMISGINNERRYV